MATNINDIKFPYLTEGDRVLHEDGKWYIYTNGTWVLENN
jgi:hypothetical protein